MSSKMVAITSDSPEVARVVDFNRKGELEAQLLMTHVPGSLDLMAVPKGRSLEVYRAVRMCNLADHLYNSEVHVPSRSLHITPDLLKTAQAAAAKASAHGCPIRVERILSHIKEESRIFLRLETTVPVQCDAGYAEARKQIDALLGVEKAIDDRFRTRKSNKPRS